MLGASIGECLAAADRAGTVLASLRRGKPERETMLQACELPSGENETSLAGPEVGSMQSRPSLGSTPPSPAKGTIATWPSRRWAATTFPFASALTRQTSATSNQGSNSLL